MQSKHINDPVFLWVFSFVDETFVIAQFGQDPHGGLC